MQDVVDARSFFELGYIVLAGAFTRPEVERMRAAFERLAAVAAGLDGPCMHAGSQFVVERDASVAGGVRIHRVVWCGAAEPELAAFGTDPRLLSLASRLLGSTEMQHLINQAHFKMPGDGVEFPWHQDSTHRRFGGEEWKDVNGRGSYVQTVIALDDIDETNGPIRLIPGSCRHGHIDVGVAGQIPSRFIDGRPIVAATMAAGDVLAFGPYTIHASTPNLSSGPRRVLINGYAYPGANSRVYPGEGSGKVVRFS